MACAYIRCGVESLTVATIEAVVVKEVRHGASKWYMKYPVGERSAMVAWAVHLRKSEKIRGKREFKNLPSLHNSLISFEMTIFTSAVGLYTAMKCVECFYIHRKSEFAVRTDLKSASFIEPGWEEMQQ